MSDFVDRLDNLFADGRFSRRRRERVEAAKAELNNAIRQLDHQMRVNAGREILAVRTRELSSKTVEQLQAIAAKADSDNVFPSKAITYRDYYTIACAAAELQSIPLPRSLESPEEFTRKFSRKGEVINPDDPVTSSKMRRRFHKTQVGYVKVAVDEEIGGHEGQSPRYELLIAPSDTKSRVSGEITDAVWNKISKAVPLRDTTWLNSIWQNEQE